MKRSLVLIGVLSLLLVSCRGNKQVVTYLDCGSVLFVAVQDNHSMVVLAVPGTLVQGYSEELKSPRFAAVEALTGLAPDYNIQATEALYEEVKALSTTLVVNREGIERTAVDDQMRIDAILGSASGLRKTNFAATLATLSGFEDPLGLLEQIKRILVLDLGTVFAANENNDWESMRQFLGVYLEGVLQFQRRSMTE